MAHLLSTKWGRCVEDYPSIHLFRPKGVGWMDGYWFDKSNQLREKIYLVIHPSGQPLNGWIGGRMDKKEKNPMDIVRIIKGACERWKVNTLSLALLGALCLALAQKVSDYRITEGVDKPEEVPAGKLIRGVYRILWAGVTPNTGVVGSDEVGGWWEDVVGINFNHGLVKANQLAMKEFLDGGGGLPDEDEGEEYDELESFQDY